MCAELDEYIAPALARLKDGMGKGGQILTVKDDVGNDTYIRYSENDLWYRDFFKEHKRKPTVAELEDMAVAMVTGDASAPKVEGWIPDSAETAEAMAEAAPAIEKLRDNLSVMERIKPHMKEMTSAEMKLTEGLSPEAFHVYRDLSKKLSVIGGQTAPVARLNAILFARHADIFANAVSKKTGEKLTAKDYYERFFGLDSEGKHKADMYQAAERRAEENLRVDEKVWKEELKKVFRNELEGDSFVTIMRTPLALQLVGARDLPVKIKVSKLRRILKDHPNMSKDTLRQLPRAMTDPMIIFKSQTVQGRLVVALTLKDNDGVNVVVPMELDSTDGALDANIVTSAFMVKMTVTGMCAIHGIGITSTQRIYFMPIKKKLPRSSRPSGSNSP